jgi:hypothetical protein
MGPQPSGKFLAVLKVAAGGPPGLDAAAISAPGIQGAAWDDKVVVFSTRPRGEAAALPFSFEVKDTGAPRQILLANMRSPCDVTLTRQNGKLRVQVTAGARHTPSAQGVVQLWQ